MMPKTQEAAMWLGRLLLDAQPFISCAIGIAIVVYLVHRLLCCATQYSRAERFSMACIAAGMVLATPALWMYSTPFDAWSFNLGRLGVALYILQGGMRRDRHRHRNMAQQAYAEGFTDGRAAGRKNP